MSSPTPNRATVPASPPIPPRPPSAPSLPELANQEQFDKLVDESLDSTMASAEKWRNGLAGFVSILSTGLLLKGPDTVKDIASGWRYPLAACVGIGLLGVIVGLWFALGAAAGTPHLLTLPALLAEHESVRGYRVDTAAKLAESLKKARRAFAGGLAFLTVAAFSMWWLPDATSTAAPKVIVTSTAGDTTCGELKSAEGSEFKIQTKTRSTPVVVAFGDVVDVVIASICSP